MNNPRQSDKLKKQNNFLYKTQGIKQTSPRAEEQGLQCNVYLIHMGGVYLKTYFLELLQRLILHSHTYYDEL